MSFRVVALQRLSCLLRLKPTASSVSTCLAFLLETLNFDPCCSALSLCPSPSYRQVSFFLARSLVSFARSVLLICYALSTLCFAPLVSFWYVSRLYLVSSSTVSSHFSARSSALVFIASADVGFGVTSFSSFSFRVLSDFPGVKRLCSCYTTESLVSPAGHSCLCGGGRKGFLALLCLTPVLLHSSFASSVSHLFLVLFFFLASFCSSFCSSLFVTDVRVFRMLHTRDAPRCRRASRARGHHHDDHDEPPHDCCGCVKVDSFCAIVRATGNPARCEIEGEKTSSGRSPSNFNPVNSHLGAPFSSASSFPSFFLIFFQSLRGGRVLFFSFLAL